MVCMRKLFGQECILQFISLLKSHLIVHIKYSKNKTVNM